MIEAYETHHDQLPALHQKEEWSTTSIHHSSVEKKTSHCKQYSFQLQPRVNRTTLMWSKIGVDVVR